MRHHEALLQRGRKYPAAGVHLQPDSPNIVFLTVTTEKRKAWLANETGHQLLRQVWLEATAWLVGDYLLMPDHLHCFCAPRDPTITIEHWITFWKREFRRDHGRQDWRFQSRAWHHRLRNGESYVEKWNYVQLNPVRRGLVNCLGEWPYQGRIHPIG